ncbi:MAG: GIY-YIG nuclease family protein, partial [Fusobacterium sp.]
MTGIYKITNNITGSFYIGQSINIEKRFKEHKRKKLKTKLSKDFQKYG